MIKFLDDYRRYPTAILDTHTTNESFLRLVKVYKSMGIKNHAFPLVLFQPELQGVDPYSEDLTNVQKAMIAKECKYNPWYFLREVSRIPINGTPVPSKFLANRANICMFWCFLNNVDIAIIMPRQCGKSVGGDTLTEWIIDIAGASTSIQLLTKDAKLRKANIMRLKKMREVLPTWLINITGDDADNQEELTNKALKNNYQTAVAQKAKDVAENVGRGLTSEILQSDEGPYCPNIHISLPVAMSSGTAARDIAEKNGTFYGNIFTTTAGKKDSKEGAFMYNLIHNGMYWNERLMDCHNKEHLIDTIEKNSVGDRVIINGTFSHRQIGKSDLWLKKAIVNSGSSRDMANRDYLNVWTSGSVSSPLSNDINDVIRESGRDADYTQTTKDNYMLSWYIPARDIERRLANTHFLICIDSSNAVGKDANGMTLLDLKNLETIGSSNISEANIYRYAVWVANMLILYPHSTLIIENKSSGQSILDTVAIKLIAAGINPYKRIFNRVIDQRERYSNAYTEVTTSRTVPTEDEYLANKGKFGFMTTGPARYHLYDTVLQRAASCAGHLVNDKELSDQILGLVEKNGRVDHQDGSHDDMVISWLLGHWFANHAKELSWYGIKPGLVQSMVTEGGAGLSPEESMRRNEQAKVYAEIDAIKDAIATTQSPVQKMALETRLALAVSRIDNVEEKTLVMENIIAEVREQAKSKRSLCHAVRRHQGRR